MRTGEGEWGGHFEGDVVEGEGKWRGHVEGDVVRGEAVENEGITKWFITSLVAPLTEVHNIKKR